MNAALSLSFGRRGGALGFLFVHVGLGPGVLGFSIWTQYYYISADSSNPHESAFGRAALGITSLFTHSGWGLGVVARVFHKAILNLISIRPQGAFGRAALGITSLFTYIGLGLGVLGSGLALPFGLYILIVQRSAEAVLQDSVTPPSSSRQVRSYQSSRDITSLLHRNCHFRIEVRVNTKRKDKMCAADMSYCPGCERVEPFTLCLLLRVGMGGFDISVILCICRSPQQPSYSLRSWCCCRWRRLAASQTTSRHNPTSSCDAASAAALRETAFAACRSAA